MPDAADLGAADLGAGDLGAALRFSGRGDGARFSSRGLAAPGDAAFAVFAALAALAASRSVTARKDAVSALFVCTL